MKAKKIKKKKKMPTCKNISYTPSYPFLDFFRTPPSDGDIFGLVFRGVPKQNRRRPTQKEITDCVDD